MSSFSDRIKALSPERRALLQTLLMERNTTAARKPAIPPRQNAGAIPLLFAQERLWFLNELEPESPFYNVHEAARLIGPLDVVALKRTLNEIVRRHEVLRTTLHTIDGKPMQVVTSDCDLSLTEIDISALPDAEQESELQELSKREALRPFDLANGPLMRTTLVRLGDQHHVVLLTLHHIISDAWSMGVLIRELLTLYHAFSAGRPSPLAELPIQYADFASWQRQFLTGDVLQKQLDYWKQQLDNAPPVLQLSIANPRPPVQSFKGGTLNFTVPQALTDDLKELSRKEGVTLFMTLLAAFQVLLYRYSGNPDVVVGCPIANRTLQETESLIGFFANTLVLRGDMSNDPTFLELLQQIRETTVNAYAHQDLPFEKLVEKLQPKRSLSYSPLFQVVFAWQNAPQMQVEFSDLRLSSIRVETETSKFDITLMMAESKNGLTGELEFNTDIFTRDSVECFLKHFLTLLRDVASGPERRISRMQLLDREEREHLTLSLNDTFAEYARERCLHDLFTEQAKRTPTAVALVGEKETLTYWELEEQANRLARYLRGKGVTIESRVGILLERSVEMIVTVLAVLKAGAAYVPLDPKYPVQHLKLIAEDATFTVVVARTHDAERLKGIEHQKVVLLDVERPQIDAQVSETLATKMSSLNAAYVIYTSGSTGNPKGVVGLHRGAINRFEWMWNTYPFAAGEVCCQKTSLNFLDSLWEIFGPLLKGVPIVIIPDETVKDQTRLIATLAEKQVTRIVLVPSLLRVIRDFQPELQKLLPELKWWVTSGEALSLELFKQFREVMPAAVLLNLYGSSEVSADATWYDTSEGIPSTSIPIGRPIANTQIYLLDQNLQPSPVGIPGELYVGGDGLARGYHELPALTAEHFIPDPFATGPGARIYHSGDIARHLPDGNIEYLGRVDSQVKVRGFRIELGEIEILLKRHPKIRQAVVITRQDGSIGKRLVAYLVAAGADEPNVSEVRDFVQQHLPDFMVPAVFVNLKELPLTPSGKVDRLAFLAMDQAKPEVSTGFIGPRNLTEQILADTWARVLGVQSVGVHDNFFELGGDSILSIQLTAIAAKSGLHFSTKQLFQYQTIAELVQRLSIAPLNQAPQEPVTGDVKLTPIQQWFFELPLDEPHHFNQAVMLEASCDIDEAVLERAVAELLYHHDALRMRFMRSATGWNQFNQPPDDTAPYSRVDVSGLNDKEELTAIEAASRKLNASLNLSDGPLLRVALFVRGANKSARLLIAIHHLVVDGVSWRILLSDLESAYEQIRRGEKTVQLPPKTTSYQQWAARLEEYARSDRARAEASFWLRNNQPTKALPRDKPGKNTLSSLRNVTVALTAEETRTLIQEVPQAYQTQINDVLLIAFAQAFQQWTAGPRILVDLEAHGREEDLFNGIDLSRTVGWFTTIFPVVLDMSNSTDSRPAWGESLKSIKEQLRAIPNRGLGYGVLRYLSADAELMAQLKSQLQAEVSFNYLGQFDTMLAESALFRLLPEASGGPASTRGMRHYVLEVTGYISGGQLFVRWVYNEELHRRDTIECVAQTFIQGLRSLIEHCVSPGAGGRTPSDFSAATLNQEELDAFLSKIAAKL